MVIWKVADGSGDKKIGWLRFQGKEPPVHLNYINTRVLDIENSNLSDYPFYFSNCNW